MQEKIERNEVREKGTKRKSTRCIAKTLYMKYGGENKQKKKTRFFCSSSELHKITTSTFAL